MGNFAAIVFAFVVTTVGMNAIFSKFKRTRNKNPSNDSKTHYALMDIAITAMVNEGYLDSTTVMDNPIVVNNPVISEMLSELASMTESGDLAWIVPKYELRIKVFEDELGNNRCLVTPTHAVPYKAGRSKS